MTMAKSAAISAPSGGLVRNVQALRGVSALLIVVAHLDAYLTPMGPAAYRSVSLGIAGTAIGLFFVISGFIMVHTTIDRQMSPWTFMANRVSRIVPLYWTLTMVVFVVALVAPTLLQATSADLTALIKSLAFIPFSKSNGVTEPLLFVGWTLNIEMMFYLIFAIGLMFNDRSTGILTGFLFLLCLVVVGPAVLPRGPLTAFYTSSIVLDFGLGMLIGLMSRRAPHVVNLSVQASALIIALISFAVSMVLPSVFPGMPLVLACGVPAAFVVGSAVLLERWGLSIKSALWLLLGNASYSIYLSHPFATQLIGKILAPAKTFGLVNLSIIAIALIASSVVGVGSYFVLERPMLHLSRRFVRQRRGQGAGAVNFRSTHVRSRVPRLWSG